MGPDLLVVNGVVQTLGPTGPPATAIAIESGRITAVGGDEEVLALRDAHSEVIDARGSTVCPGFQDAHVHPPQGGVEMLRCNLTSERSRDGFRRLVAQYAAANPDATWILGGGWSMEAFPEGVPTAADLDDVAGGRPVYLPNRDHHSAWVSSSALALAGVDKTTPDPPDGRIERDEHGNPTGALHDGAMSLVGQLVPPTGPSELRDGLLVAQAYLHSLGITAWQDAIVGSFHGFDDSFETYLDLDEHDLLTARVAGALWWERDRGLDQVEGLLERRARASTGRFRATSVKIMQDGVCETFTAAMLRPYLDREGHDTGHCGPSFVDPEELKRYVSVLDREGFQVHVHAIGDRAVREALDAMEGARARELRHHLAHLQVVHPDDLARFARLGVVANFQPLWACAEAQMVELTMPFLGEERSSWQYPIGSLSRQGARVAFGSDWPVSSPDPLAGMHVAVERTPPPGEPGASGVPSFTPAERIDLPHALRAFTLGAAYVNHLEAETGSIEIGKLADLVILDRDIFSLDAADGGVSGARVLLTLVDGRPVFEASGS